MENQTKQQAIGKITSGGFILRQHIGDAKTPDGKDFEIATTMSGAPLVLYNDKCFALSWNDICNLAEQAGLFKEGGGNGEGDV